MEHVSAVMAKKERGKHKLTQSLGRAGDRPVWAAAGHGTGEVAVTPECGNRTGLSPGLTMTMKQALWLINGGYRVLVTGG